MIVNTLQRAEASALFGSHDSRLLIAPRDDVGHILVDTNILAGVGGDSAQVPCGYPFRSQAHYCIDGTGACFLDDAEYSLKPGTLIASSARHGLRIKSMTNMRIVSIFHVDGDPTADPLVRNLEDIYGTERDVYWGNGRSRRLLLRRDRFGFGLCVTTGEPGTDSPLEYRRHFESCYYISGTGEYEWESGRHPIETGSDQATVFIMDKHDAHHMRIVDASVCLSIFTPPLDGDECHDFSKGRTSSY